MSTSNRDNRTVHGKFKFGFKTKHRFPSIISSNKELMDVATLLYPTGRAWQLPEKSNYKVLHDVFNNALQRVKTHAFSMMNSYFPDNDEFSLDDCEFWEYKLGLIGSNSLSLEKRKEIILRKMAFPRGIEARQSLSYIQSQLDIYGFEVGVFENIFYDVNGNYYHANPRDISQQSLLNTQHGWPTQHGAAQHGSGSFDIIANHIDEELYNIGGEQNLYATFFLASRNDLNNAATVPASRKKEFKELILKLKPAHQVAFCLINYI